MKALNPFDVSFSGIHLIEASAGTGKTYNIESLYIRAIIDADYTVDQILVVTYTEAATKELRDRLMRRLRKSIRALEGESFEADSFLKALPNEVADHPDAIAKLKQAIRSFDEAAIYTIHGFCGQALRDYAFESRSSFDVELIGDDSEIVREVIDDYWRKWVAEASDHEVKRPLLQFILDKGYSPEKLTSELSGYIGKPYLKIEPREISHKQYENIIEEMGELYHLMQQNWKKSKEEIRSLLLSDPMNGRRYQERYLDNWMPQMDEWLKSEVVPTGLFDYFSRFSQSYVNESLKKSSKQKGISPPEHPFFKHADAYTEKVNALDSYEAQFKRQLFSEIITEVQDAKEQQQVYSYDDLLLQLRDALCGERGNILQKQLRRSYPIALVDEFQDTDPIQYQIFNKIYSGSDDASLFMIGDPKQSIYSFRGADIFSYLTAQKDAPPGNVFNLGENYRSVPGLIEGVNAIFKATENPFILNDISFKPVQPGKNEYKQLEIKGKESAAVEVRHFPHSIDEGPLNINTANTITAQDTARQIQALLTKSKQGEAQIGKEPLEAGDIAVLVRTHRQGMLVRQALQELDIKSVTHSKESVFKAEEAGELQIVLKAIVEPGNEQLITSALATVLFEYDANDLIALRDDEAAWAAKIDQFLQWNEMWQQHGFGYMFRTMMDQEDVAESLIRYTDGERKLTNFVHLADLIQKEEQNGKAGIHTLYKWLLKKRNAESKDIEEEQLRLESDENLVNVVTMHHSKGLEYPVVFCPFLWKSPLKQDNGNPLSYHDPEDKSEAYVDFSGKDDPERSGKRLLKAKEDLAESVRLAYVAITRAKYRCVINWLPAKKSPHSPLGLLLLGHEKSFASLEAAIFSNHEIEKNLFTLFEPAIRQLAESNEQIDTPVISAAPAEQTRSMQFAESSELQARQFKRTTPLPEGYGMASFSSLIRHEQDDFDPNFHAYYDEPYEEPDEEMETEGDNIFDFPKGPEPGTAIHHIFENILFDDSEKWNGVIGEVLLNQDIDEKWQPVVHDMLKRTVNKSLLANQPDLKMANISADEMIPEMEFYFTNGKVELSKLLGIIRPDDLPVVSAEGFAGEGYLKGFIDLTFRYNNKYYILDYKTNHLGDSLEDYRADALSDEITEAMYDLQYHLYLAALHRYLKQRLRSYSYEKHIGGAFYLFVRGINEGGEEGIYFDRPSGKRIKELDEYLKRNRG